MAKYASFSGFLFFLFLTGVFLVSNPKLHAAEKCSVSGRVSDSNTKEGLPFASLQLSSPTDSTFSKAVISDLQGRYVFKDIAPGTYQLDVAFMGYEPLQLQIQISETRQKLDVLLERKKFILPEVEVQAEKVLTSQSIEKTVVNVSKNNTVSGGNAMDVLQTLPAVDIDFDGKLQYRGSDRVTVLLNGQRSEMVKSLDQIPAGQIEKIEIINNPSAKYEADGMSGIINIVLKTAEEGKNKTTLRTYAGLPETYGGNAGLSKFSKSNSFFINAGYDHKTRFQTKEHLRKNFGDLTLPDYYQYDRQDEILNNVMLNTGFNLKLNENQKLGLSLVGSKRFNSADRSIDYQTLDNNGSLLFQSYKDIDITLDNYTLDGDLNHQKQFGRKGQKLETNFHYALLDQSHKMDNILQDVSGDSPNELQNTNSEQLNKIVAFSTDYTHPLSDSLLMETGYRYSRRNLLNNFTSSSYDAGNATWVTDADLSNRFHYIQDIHAVYVDFSAKFRFFDLQAGLRLEQTTNEQIDERKEDYLNLFPSVTFSKKLSKHVTGFLTFNRRINRPTIKMLNPYTNEYADILNQHIGNPELKPEYVNSAETGTRLVFEKISGSVSVYYRNIDQAISRVKSATNDSALTVTFMNLDNAQLLGSEINFSVKITKWWQLHVGANIFHTSLIGEYGPNKINRSLTGWTGSFSSSFKLPHKLNYQVSGTYKSELPDVMGTYMERYFVDMAVSKPVLHNKGKLIFKISDVFNTYRYGLDLTGIDDNGFAYSQRNRRKNESQYFILSFVYNLDSKSKQKKTENYFLEEFGK